MSGRFLIGLDLGGSGVRCLVVDVSSGRTHVALRTLAFRSQPGDPMTSELAPDEVWTGLAAAAREALERAGAGPDAVLGIAATSMRHASVLLDGDGEVLLATTNRDARGAARAIELADLHGAEIHRRTGHWPNPVQPAPRLCAFAASRPEAFARAAHHLSLSDWVAYRLCGEIATEASQASETLLCQIAERAWASDWIDRLDLPRHLFPEIRPAGTALGGLTAEAAAELGLRAGTPVALGGGDTQSAGLGAGAVAPGDLVAVGGTSIPVQAYFSLPTLAPDGRLWSSHHVVPGIFALESNGGVAGDAIDWIARLLHPDRTHPVLHFLAEAAAARPGAAGLVSTFGAQAMDARALAFPVGDLTLSHLVAAGAPDRRGLLARAITEGLAYAVRVNIEQTEAASGAAHERLRLGGGLSRSPFLAQLFADVTGRRVDVAAAPESSALGAAVCAGMGAGVFADLAEGAAKLAHTGRVHEPDAARVALYDELYRGWRDLVAAREPAKGTATGLLLRGLASAAPAGSTAAASDFRPRMLVAAELDEEALARLRELGEVEYASYRQAKRMLTGPSLVQALEGVHVFVTEIDVVNAGALLQAHDLRAIGVCRGDAVNVDLEACTALGIPVVNTPGRNADAVADLALAFLLMLARRLPEANAFLREPGGRAGDMGRMGRAFGSLRGRELWHKTIGLVGLGAVGRKVAERLRPFGARCVVADPYLDPDAVRLAGGDPVSLDELLAQSDFVSLHAAVTDETRGLIGARELSLMRPGSCLVNTARAALVDQDALLEALQSGHLAGAALDVFAVEPPASDDPLLALPNVVATPHVGGNTFDVASHQGRIIAEELGRLARGERPRHLLNPETLEDFDLSRPRPIPDPALAERLGKGPGPAVSDLQKSAKAKPGAPKQEAPQRAGAQAAEAPAHAPETPAPASPDTSAVRDAMRRVLAAFVANVKGDAALAEFARGRDVALHFTLTDLDLDFHVGFRADAVVSDLGPPEGEAEVELEMRADLLDGMFTGRLNPMQAAMAGELSFSGDTAKAMTLTHVQPDLERCYRAAREAAGDPGDLAALPAPGAPAARPAAAEGADAAKDELLAVVQELYASELITATGGNVSVRIGAEEAWITPSQLFKGDLSPEVLVRIGMDGRAVARGGRAPSSEALMHTAVYEARPEVQAVIHCHAPHATILANAGLPFLPVSTEAAFLVNIGRVPFVMPGTQELADAVVGALGEGWAVLMQNHGLLVAGRTLRRAADMAEIVERTAEVILGCYAVGKEPPTLPEDTVKMLASYGDLMA